MRSPSPALLALQLCVGVAAVATNLSPPAVTCATCHDKECRSQPQTPMAHAMVAPATDPVFQQHANITFARGAYTWRVSRSGNDVTYAVTDGTNSIAVPVRWIFGENIQTYLLDYNGHSYESRVSWFPQIEKLDITPGDEKEHLDNIIEALGRDVLGRERQACFECHSTGAVVDGRLQPASSTPGLQCSHCHQGVDRHLRAVVNGKLDSVPPKLGRMTAEDTSNFCGQCHRTFGEVVRRQAYGLANARFQPYRLARSKCYDGSDSRISCLACHDPHQNLVTNNDAFYEVKCLACHAPAAASHAATGKQMAKPCPVAKTGCIGCHMPKVNLPPTHREWTDHFIRVVQAGAPYPE